MIQGELAKLTNVSKQAIDLIEKGNPSLKLRVEIYKSLSVTLNDLFWEED